MHHFSFSFWFRITFDSAGSLIKIKYQHDGSEDELLHIQKLLDYYSLIVKFQGKEMQSETLLKYYHFYSIQINFVNQVVSLQLFFY